MCLDFFWKWQKVVVLVKKLKNLKVKMVNLLYIYKKVGVIGGMEGGGLHKFGH
jgi:hypothetical protein